MGEQDEAILVVAVYVFVVTVFTLPVVLVYLFFKISKLIKRATKIISYVEESEIESRKYHE